MHVNSIPMKFRTALDINIGQCDMWCTNVADLFGAQICLVNSILHVILDAQIHFVQ